MELIVTLNDCLKLLIVEKLNLFVRDDDEYKEMFTKSLL